MLPDRNVILLLTALAAISFLFLSPGPLSGVLQRLWREQAGIGELLAGVQGAGNLKDLFAEMTEVRPVHAVLQENVEYDKQNEPGNLYKFPALLSFQGGAIPSAFGSLPSAATMAEGPLSAEIQYGQVQGFNITVPVVTPFDMMAASSNGKKSAYANIPQLIMYTAKMAAERDTELSNLCGQFGLGVVAAAGIGAETPTTDTGRLGAGFYRDVTFTAASWADGVFAGADRHRFDFFDTTGATQRNVTGAIPYCSIIQVVFNTQTVRFFFPTSTNLNTLAATDVLWRRNFKTAGGFNEAQGLLSAFSATSGNVWGLSTTFSQWKTNPYAVGGALTFGKLAKGLQVAVSRSNLRKPMEVYCSNQSWADLIRDLADLTRNNQPPIQTLKNGATKIEYAIQTGPVRVINAGYLPNGFAIAFPEGTCRRVGATEPTMELGGNELSVMSTATTGYQFNVYGNQAIINVMLGATTLFTGIVADA